MKGLCTFVCFCTCTQWEQPASCLHAVDFMDYAPTTAPSFQHDVPTDLENTSSCRCFTNSSLSRESNACSGVGPRWQSYDELQPLMEDGKHAAVLCDANIVIRVH